MFHTHTNKHAASGRLDRSRHGHIQRLGDCSDLSFGPCFLAAMDVWALVRCLSLVLLLRLADEPPPAHALLQWWRIHPMTLDSYHDASCRIS